MGRVITTDSKHSHPRFPNLIQEVTAVYPDHIWVADITYLRFGRQFMYLAVILDAYTRAVRGWHLEEVLTCEALTLPALKMALHKGTPLYFHSD
jgi:putative transposase